MYNCPTPDIIGVNMAYPKSNGTNAYLDIINTDDQCTAGCDCERLVNQGV